LSDQPELRRRIRTAAHADDQGRGGPCKKAFAKKPDKTGRIAIPLDDTPPSTEGKLLP